MGRLDDFTLDDLHEHLERTKGNTPTQRVLADIGRKQGATLGELAERHNVAEKTIDDGSPPIGRTTDDRSSSIGRTTDDGSSPIRRTGDDETKVFVGPNDAGPK